MNASGIRIRPYAPADYEYVKANLVAVGMYDDVSDARENLASITRHSSDAVLVAEANNTVVGSIVTTSFGQNVALVWRFAIAKEYQSQGVGSLLLEAAEKMLKSKGYKEVWGFMDTKRPDLAAYYTKRGFQHNPEHRYFAIWKPL